VNIHSQDCSYVLVTPARNEEENIEMTIRSVIAQTTLPRKWIIVSDGSTDRTDEIVKGYASKYSWIELVRMPEHRDRQFAAKVHCFNAGYDRLKGLHYDVIGNLDADISFDRDYFAYLLDKFSAISDLGVAGTPFVEDDYSSIRDGFDGEAHVAGGCQLFRRECFEQIGGYIPVKGGGIDWIAVTTARMRGWKTLSFKDKHFFHHRPLGTAESNTIQKSYDYGKKDYFLGGHPVWECFRVFYRIMKKPRIIGGVALMVGYFSCMIRRVERPVSDELMRFHRQEQMNKLKNILKTALTFKKIDKFHISTK